MEIAGRRKRLADQFRTDGFAVFEDQRAIGLVGKDRLAYAPDRQRVQNAKTNSEDEYH
jgi:hypothetical protein